MEKEETLLSDILLGDDMPYALNQENDIDVLFDMLMVKAIDSGKPVEINESDSGEGVYATYLSGRLMVIIEVSSHSPVEFHAAMLLDGEGGYTTLNSQGEVTEVSKDNDVTELDESSFEYHNAVSQMWNSTL